MDVELAKRIQSRMQSIVSDSQWKPTEGIQAGMQVDSILYWGGMTIMGVVVAWAIWTIVSSLVKKSNGMKKVSKKET